METSGSLAWAIKGRNNMMSRYFILHTLSRS
jgi:hypothetical protein